MRTVVSGIMALGLAAGFLLTAPSPSVANLVTNGSFEDPVIVCTSGTSGCQAPDNATGWTHAGGGDGPRWRVGYADGGGNISVAGAGDQFVTMGGGGGVGTASWTQTITGLALGLYDLTFDMASETGAFGQTLTVSFTGSDTPSQDFSAPASAGSYWKTWVPEAMSVHVTGSTLTLQFSATTSQDVGLDAVSLVPPQNVPEPASLLLVGGVGLASFGVAAIRRRARRR